ncbi:MAG: SLOG family protein, partial [Clostridia bacterium]|nr:SLOG family protein [Clostridia bacterium]
LITVVSYKGQADGWSEMWRERYNRILDYSEEVITLSERYNGGCYHARNRHMVDKADVLLALHSGGMAGEAAYVIRYARQKCKEVIQINPDTMERREVLPQAE